MDIDKIILKALNKKASLEEYEALEAWKKESSENLEYLSSLIDDNQDSFTPYTQFDKNEAWNKMSPKIGSPNYSFRALAVASIIILIGLSVYFVQCQSKYPKVHKSENHMAEFILDDDSKIFLNRQSRLTQISDFSSHRNVALEGEAYFEVSKDVDKPFTIQLKGDDFVKVVGTSFNLLNSGDQLDLKVYSGKVELHTLNRVIELRKNDCVRRVNGVYVKFRNNELNTISWKTKELVFDDIPLDDVFTELEDYFNVSFEVDIEDEAESCNLRSSFSDQSLDQVMEELKKLFNFNYRIQGNKVEVSELKCK